MLRLPGGRWVSNEDPLNEDPLALLRRRPSSFQLEGISGSNPTRGRL